MTSKEDSTAVAAARSLPRVRDLRTFWRRALAVIAPIPGLALALEIGGAPGSPGDAPDQRLSAFAAHLGQADFSLWMGVIAILTAVPAVIAAGWATRRAAPRLTVAGGMLTLIGFSLALDVADTSSILYVAARDGLNRQATAQLTQLVGEHPAAIAALVGFLVAQAAGLLVLGIALWRTRLAPRWAAAVLAVSGVAHVLAPGSIGSGLAWAATGVGFAGASVALWRMGDEDFDRPPVGADQPAQAQASGVGRFDARSVWRVLLALTAPMTAVVIAVLRLALPYNTLDDARTVFEQSLAHQTFDTVALWAGLLLALTAVCGPLAVVWVSRRRTPILASIGAFLAVPGFIALAGQGSAQNVITLLAAQGKTDPGIAYTVADAVQSLPQSGALVGVFVFGHLIGTVLLGMALWRSHTVPAWIAWALAVSQPIHLLSAMTGNHPLDLLGWGLTALGFAAAGLALLRMRNDEFDLPPTADQRP
ncbi:DUF4386 family protein [Sinomonas gamaensis]|uniref:DUF4386 family protein n=1 Tax=Sinomonas gamaensis TaxID=2565624 RepID=UPI001109899F|nr:DUF4386 family protein [Sinomonas gamaensis]